MNHSTQQAVAALAITEFSEFSCRSLQTGETETIAEIDSPVARESLSEKFHDEIDAWARRALAANGFGDCP